MTKALWEPLNADADTLGKLIEDAAHSLDMSAPDDAEITSDVRYAATNWDGVVDDVLGRLAVAFPTVHGGTGTRVTATDLWQQGDGAPYLLYMTLAGAGVGIWDDWDIMYDRARLRRGGDVRDWLEHDPALRVAFGKLEEAIDDAAFRTAGHVPFPERDDWRAEVNGYESFAYQGDLYCADDAALIEEDADSPSSLDSDKWPQPVDSDESSDSVEHCGKGERCANAITLPSGTKIGAWLGNPLTRDGEQELCESLSTAHAHAPHSFWVNALWAYLYRDVLTRCRIRAEFVDPVRYAAAELSGRALPPPTMAEQVLDEMAAGDEMRQWGLPEAPAPYYGGMEAQPPLMLTPRRVWTDADRADWPAAVERGMASYEAYGVPRERVRKSIVALRERRPRLREGYDYNPRRPQRHPLQWLVEALAQEKFGQARVEHDGERFIVTDAEGEQWTVVHAPGEGVRQPGRSGGSGLDFAPLQPGLQENPTLTPNPEFAFDTYWREVRWMATQPPMHWPRLVDAFIAGDYLRGCDVLRWTAQFQPYRGAPLLSPAGLSAAAGSVVRYLTLAGAELMLADIDQQRGYSATEDAARSQAETHALTHEEYWDEVERFTHQVALRRTRIVEPLLSLAGELDTHPFLAVPTGASRNSRSLSVLQYTGNVEAAVTEQAFARLQATYMPLARAFDGHRLIGGLIAWASLASMSWDVWKRVAFYHHKYASAGWGP